MLTHEYTPIDDKTKEPLVEGAVFLIRPANGRQRGQMVGEIMKIETGTVNAFDVFYKICSDHCVGWRGLPIPDYNAKAKHKIEEWDPDWVFGVGTHIAEGCPVSDDPEGNLEPSSAS